MNYIIDGHNLIAKVEGLSLSMLDDEQRLIELLNRYGELRRHKIEVYFDGAPVGQVGIRNFGRVRAHFVAMSQTADDAIHRRLTKMGRASREARNWVVVSSDRSVQSAAREAQAQVMSAEDFASHLQTSLLQARAGNPENTPEQQMSEAELKEWLTIFKEQGKQK
jgi:predicted RNA-binding protein with PIN domain